MHNLSFVSGDAFDNWCIFSFRYSILFVFLFKAVGCSLFKAIFRFFFFLLQSCFVFFFVLRAAGTGTAIGRWSGSETGTVGSGTTDRKSVV